MKNKKVARILSVGLGAVMLAGTAAGFAGCGGDKSYLVLMTENLEGLFNPFFASSSPDVEIMSMTQISMLTTEYARNPETGADEAVLAYGDDHAVVIKDLQYETKGGETEYTFVLKNGIKFSDGKPLTMNDVLFNMYVYLDPVYTGSSTMYSTDIVGLQTYRTQQNLSGSASDQDAQLTKDATGKATIRTNELINLYRRVGDTGTQGSYSASEEQMKTAIASHNPSGGYKGAIAPNGNISDDEARKQLLADYTDTLEEFKTELGNDYDGAMDSYTEEPYKSSPVKFDELVSFMYAEGFVEVEYEKDPVTNKENKNKFTKVTLAYNTEIVKDRDSAINYVYEATVKTGFEGILKYWGTAGKMNTKFIAKATDVILHERVNGNTLTYPKVEGIDSLGHNTDIATVNVDGTEYKVAHEHNPDGTPANANEYDVLRVRINGVDPKAIWNFGFSVAPQHYYAPGNTVDIANNNFGVTWGSFDFMQKVLLSVRNAKVPVGAGPYVATDKNDNDNPDGSDFYSANTVYFKANENFLMGVPKTKNIRYQVTSSNNALNALETGSVHYVTPQFTTQNKEKLDGDLAKKGMKQLDSWQLGYGYIGINAGKVPNINIRKAIMSAMDISLSLSYYSQGTAKPIYWPMSTVSWAYPKSGNAESTDNGHDYMRFEGEAKALEKIKRYQAAAGYPNGYPEKLKFTIAGSNMSEHPTYLTFQTAADLLNQCGWNVEVEPDMMALTKLSTGSLSVWAAAWSATVDPDMYQVYHKNSKATSTLSWGYREILAAPSSYPTETRTLNELSALIDQGRESEDRTFRTNIYQQAMSKVLDLAVEMPVYQRRQLYAYNANIIKESSLPSTINPFSTPLEKIWEIELV
ncbi:MAG: hypothetical protein K2L87_00475 [Clostridiales bacterium]|nr:hypothetical protein [Clostridiales bacterium]